MQSDTRGGPTLAWRTPKPSKPPSHVDGSMVSSISWSLALWSHWLPGCMGCHSHCCHAFLCLFRCEISTHKKIPWYIIQFHLYCLVLSVKYSFLCDLCTVSTAVLSFWNSAFHLLSKMSTKQFLIQASYFTHFNFQTYSPSLSSQKKKKKHALALKISMCVSEVSKYLRNVHGSCWLGYWKLIFQVINNGLYEFMSGRTITQKMNTSFYTLFCRQCHSSG